jgi:endonuclease/exonuclease/phosphatase family metal-dependent hydrolase
MRFCSLNVHLWSDRAGRGNVDQLVEFLASLRCDVIALQEVIGDGAQLHRLARTLGMHHVLGAESWIGNAILSAHPLDAVTVIPITAGVEEGRCAIMATVRAADGDIDVCATHLDPSYETTRLGELDHLVAALRSRDPTHLVMGDFNALRLADYPPAVFATVCKGRFIHDREEPRGEVIARMDALGYVDVVRLAHAGDVLQYREALGASLPDVLRSTCWVGTRIDYVWASEPLLARYTVVCAKHVATDATDHAAVVVELKPTDVGRTRTLEHGSSSVLSHSTDRTKLESHLRMGRG